MVDKNHVTYGSFIVNTEIVDDASEMSSFSHDINSFIKKSGLTRRSRIHTNKIRKIKKKNKFENFRPKELKSRVDYWRSKSLVYLKRIPCIDFGLKSERRSNEICDEYTPIQSSKRARREKSTSKLVRSSSSGLDKGNSDILKLIPKKIKILKTK